MRLGVEQEEEGVRDEMIIHPKAESLHLWSPKSGPVLPKKKPDCNL